MTKATDMHELVSIIVPVYNTEKYLAECIGSIKAQNYPKVEAILVDDGSIDLSAVLLDEAALNDSDYIIIHKNNSGQSSARNYGLNLFNGQYFCFLDSDDCISDNFLSTLYGCVIAKNADVAQCGFSRFGSSNEAPNCNECHDVPEINTLTRHEAIRQLCVNADPYYSVVWNKLYRKSIFQNLRFEIGKVYEDELIVHEIWNSIDCICTISSKMYYYRVTPNSTTTSSFSKKRLDAIYAREKRVDFLKSNPEYEDCINAEYRNILYLIIRLFTESSEDNSNNAITKSLRMKFNQYMTLLDKKQVRIRDYVWLKMFQISPSIYQKVYRFNVQRSKK